MIPDNMTRYPTRLRSCLLTAIFCLLAVSAVQAHTPPPIYLTSDLNSEELLLTCVIGEELFKDWLGIDPAGWEELDEDLSVRGFIKTAALSEMLEHLRSNTIKPATA